MRAWARVQAVQQCVASRAADARARSATDAKVSSSALFEDPVASEEWDAKKQHILNRFAVQGNITVNATFDIVGRAKRGCVRARKAPVCRARSHVEKDAQR